MELNYIIEMTEEIKKELNIENNTVKIDHYCYVLEKLKNENGKTKLIATMIFSNLLNMSK